MWNFELYQTFYIQFIRYKIYLFNTLDSDEIPNARSSRIKTLHFKRIIKTKIFSCFIFASIDIIILVAISNTRPRVSLRGPLMLMKCYFVAHNAPKLLDAWLRIHYTIMYL